LLIDARTLPGNKHIDTDVCIIGAGAAGITLAREFIGEAFRVCLLEGGGLEYESDTQSLYKGENIGLRYYPLDGSRLRYFGGTTNHWGGFCRPLDELDFEERKWIPHSGWPFPKATLIPFYKRAQSVCQLGPFAYDASDWEHKKAPSLSFSDARLTTGVFQASPPTRFGKVYRNEITHAKNITTFLYANVVDIVTTSNTKKVTSVRVACLDGNKFLVSAKAFILATGTIENARLLLLSNEVQTVGLGNQNDLVGRFFMEHPIVNNSAFIILSSGEISMALYRKRVVNNIPVTGFLTPAKQTLQQEKMLNCGMLIKQRPWSEASEGTASLKHILKTIRQRRLPDDFVHHLGNVIADIDAVAETTYRKLRGQKLLRVTYWAEPRPNPESRVDLSRERDSLGKNRVRLNWQLSDADRRNMTRMHIVVGREFGRTGLGRLKMEFDDKDTTWRSMVKGSFHHMGTTRMHVDPKKGVVDKNGRVHGISNLFVAGSSIFPTAGHANPTLTIVALALRLAKHIIGMMR